MTVRKWSLILTGQNTGCIAKFDDPWAHSPHHLERVPIMEIPADWPEHAQESGESIHIEPYMYRKQEKLYTSGGPDRLTAADYEEVLADHQQLVRKLDSLLNGCGAAKQASLSDLISQVEREGIKSRNFIPEQVALF